LVCCDDVDHIGAVCRQIKKKTKCRSIHVSMTKLVNFRKIRKTSNYLKLCSILPQ